MMERPIRVVPNAGSVEPVAEEPWGFEEFFDSHHARLFGALCLVTGDRSEAEEIMQDAFLRLWERWERVASMDDPGAYLFRTAMNVFRNRYRRSVLAMRRTLGPVVAEDAYETIDDRDVVVRALRALTANQRAAVVLTAYVGLSSEEAGGVLGMQASTVRTLATRAKAAMREKAGEPR